VNPGSVGLFILKQFICPLKLTRKYLFTNVQNWNNILVEQHVEEDSKIRKDARERRPSDKPGWSWKRFHHELSQDHLGVPFNRGR